MIGIVGINTNIKKMKIDIIKNLGYNQHEILDNIQKLYLGGKPIDCDITYSKGAFYGEFKIKNSDGTTREIVIDQPRLKFDVFPLSEDVQKIEPLTALPIESESIESMMIDLPFIVRPTKPATSVTDETGSKMFNRFQGFHTPYAMYETYFFWINEAYRVLKVGGTLLFKTQNTIYGGINHNTEFFSFMCAERCGFVTEDTFVLGAKSRMISPFMTKQLHARKFTSTFFVFKKHKSQKYKKYNYWSLIPKFEETYQ